MKEKIIEKLKALMIEEFIIAYDSTPIVKLERTKEEQNKTTMNIVPFVPASNSVTIKIEDPEWAHRDIIAFAYNRIQDAVKNIIPEKISMDRILLDLNKAAQGVFLKCHFGRADMLILNPIDAEKMERHIEYTSVTGKTKGNIGFMTKSYTDEEVREEIERLKCLKNDGFNTDVPTFEQLKAELAPQRRIHSDITVTPLRPVGDMLLTMKPRWIDNNTRISPTCGPNVIFVVKDIRTMNNNHIELTYDLKVDPNFFSRLTW